MSKITQQKEQKLFCRHGFFDSLGVIWSFGDWAVNLLLNRKENVLKEALTFSCCHLIGSTPPPPPQFASPSEGIHYYIFKYLLHSENYLGGGGGSTN
jgi:hypothetical protein